MINENFDPYDALVQAHDKIRLLEHNINELAKAHNSLRTVIKEQGMTLDLVIKGLEAANTANELLIKDQLDKLRKQITEDINYGETVNNKKG